MSISTLPWHCVSCQSPLDQVRPQNRNFLRLVSPDTRLTNNETSPCPSPRIETLVQSPRNNRQLADFHWPCLVCQRMLWWAIKRRVPRHQQLLRFEVLSNMAAPLYRNTVPAHRCETWPFSIFMNRELAAKLHFYGIRTAEFTGYMSCSLQSPSNHYRLRLEKQEWVREVESTKATHCLSLYLSDCDHPWWGANGARWHQHEDEPEALPNGFVWK